MDVLQYYQPQLDWMRFKQGELSDDVWADLCALIVLAHAHRYWKDAVRALRLQRPVSPLYKQSAYQKRKAKGDHQAEIRSLENRYYRAAFLAAGKVMAICSKAHTRTGSADYNLSIAVVKTVGIQVVSNSISGHERAEFYALAFDHFDVTVEEMTSPEKLALRWRVQAGIARSAA
jgi:hypothetical protein